MENTAQKKGRIIAVKKALPLIMGVFIISALLAGCSGKEQNTAKEIDISGTYVGTATTTAAKNSTQGSKQEMRVSFKQNNDGTATMFSDGGKEIRGVYNKDTGEFSYETGGEVNLKIQIKFAPEEKAITAKGMTTNQTGAGWTQEVLLDLKKTAD